MNAIKLKKIIFYLSFHCKGTTEASSNFTFWFHPVKYMSNQAVRDDITSLNVQPPTFSADAFFSSGNYS
jgi:hypothetical protein